MLHKIALIIALSFFAFGMVWKISAWFRYSIGFQGDRYTVWQRLYAAFKGILLTLLSRRIFTLIRVFFVEVIFQRAVYREDFLRWLMHMCIYSGFTALVLLHSMDSYLVAPFYNGYAATLNPFLFVRDLGGSLIMAGIALAIYRRFIRKVRRPITVMMDINALMLVGVVIITGFLLEAVKVTSQSTFRSMVDEYTIGADEDDINALNAYWSQNYGVSAEGLKIDTEILEKGRELHENSCQQCHSHPAWGFGGYALSVVSRPLAPYMDSAGLPDILRWMHYLGALLFLAYLPYSKMFHIVASPLSLMINAVMDAHSDPANIATRQMLELDACTHCGACTLRCSVAVAVNEIPNVNILPSEKIRSLKRFSRGLVLDRKELRTIQQGIVLCTNCNRCSIACPVGIHLRDLWFSARERLLSKGIEEFSLLSPLAFYRGLERETQDKDLYEKPIELALEGIAGSKESIGRQEVLTIGEKGLLTDLKRSILAGSLSNCYRCVTCTNSCPVVRNYENPADELGLLPHQLMHAIGLRCWDLVFNSRMLWNCLGCYECQENCPQCVAVTDILFELKNRAISRKYKDMTDEKTG